MWSIDLSDGRSDEEKCHTAVSRDNKAEDEDSDVEIDLESVEEGDAANEEKGEGWCCLFQKSHLHLNHALFYVWPRQGEGSVGYISQNVSVFQVTKD